MKSLCIIGLFSSTCALLSAQPTLNSTVTPSPGAVFPFRVVNETLDLSTTGTGQTWDFSALEPGTETNVEITAASLDPDAVDFPEATHVVTGLGPKTFYRMNSNGWEVLGFGQLGVNVVCNNSIREFPFPMNYNQQSIDLLSCNFNQLGVTFNRTGAVTSRYDGTGTLILPQSTVTDVIRVRVQELSNDAANVQGFPISNQNINTTWYFFKPNVPFALMVYSELQGTLNPTQVNTVRYNSQTDLSVYEQAAGNNVWLVQPGSDRIARIIGDIPGNSEFRLRLLDYSGRMLHATSGESEHGLISVPVSELPSGIYILELNLNGNVQSFKLACTN
jgi:hypothetical protein